MPKAPPCLDWCSWQMAKKGRAMHQCKKNEAMREKCGKRQFLLQYQKRYVDLRISNNSLNNFLSAVVLQVFTENMPLKKLFEELFQGITLDDVISTKTRNNVCGTKTADTLVRVTLSLTVLELHCFSFETIVYRLWAFYEFSSLLRSGLRPFYCLSDIISCDTYFYQWYSSRNV